MTHYKSVIAARNLNDVFAKIGWTRYGFYAYPVETETEIALQYTSEARGEKRIVTCEPLALTRWLTGNMVTPGGAHKLREICDRKPDRASRAVQPTLFPAAELAPAVKRSMNPNE